MPLIDREHEKATLEGLLEVGTHQLALVYGRRRVGKTYLLNNVWPEASVFYFTAAETTEAQNRATLVEDLAEWAGEPLNADDYPSWRAVFRLLLDIRTPEPIVVVLDEFQYLGTEVADLGAIASELNAVWEQRRPSRPFVLVLSGSAIKALEALNAGGAPLYGRFNAIIEIKPFDYGHACEIAPFRALRDRVQSYAAFGGTPLYLSLIDQKQSIEQNIARLLLAPRGAVRGLIETALVQERGLRDVAKYQAILRAIGTGSTELSTITTRAGLTGDAGTAVRRMVERLIDLGFVRAERNIGAHGTAAFRYRIDDPAFAFYYEYVPRYETALARNAALDVWTRYIAPSFDSYVGHVFERIVEQAYRRLQQHTALPMVDQWGRWEGVDRDRSSLEVDIVAPLVDGRVMTGGVKWNSATPIAAKWHYHHMDQLKRLARAGVKWAHIALKPESPLIWVAAGGFTAEFRRAAEAERSEVLLWDLGAIYQSNRLS
jgi:uncharacterized protein